MKQVYLFGDHNPETWRNGWEPEFEKMSDSESFYASEPDHIKLKTNSEIINSFSAVNLIISSDRTGPIKLARVFSKDIHRERIKNGFIEAHMHARTLIEDEMDRNILTLINEGESMITLLHRCIEKLPENTNILIVANRRTVQLLVTKFINRNKINLKFDTVFCPGVKITLNAQGKDRNIRVLHPYIQESELV